MIEVKEMTVKISVADSQKKYRKTKNAGLTAAEKKQLVRECVEKVLEILETKLER